MFHLPAKIENMPHREPVLRIVDTSDGMFIACSQDGMVTFWSGNVDHKRTRSVVVSTHVLLQFEAVCILYSLKGNPPVSSWDTSGLLS